MQEKTKLEARCPQIILNLPHGTVVEGPSGFDFYDQPLVDDHVEALPGDLLSFIEYWNRYFATDFVPPIPQLACKRCNVYMFQESEPERVIHFEKGSYD